MTAPSEPHWAAPAWAAVAVGLADGSGRWINLLVRGVGVGAVLTAAAIAQLEFGLAPGLAEPAARLFEGPILVDRVAVWTSPLPGERGLPVLTERYQEMALLARGGVPAMTAPSCAREDQTDLWREAAALPAEFWFVRPARSGDTTCLAGRAEVHERIALDGRMEDGRSAGRWDLLRMRASPQRR